MRTPAELALVDELLGNGLSAAAVARITGIPRRTIVDWRRGRRPDFRRHSVVWSGEAPPLRKSDEASYAYLLGLYLGDGCISTARRTFRLRITLDGVYPNIVEACCSAISAIVPNRVSVQRTPSRAVVVSTFSNSWPAWFPQDGPGPKHRRRIVLAGWQAAVTRREPEALICGLIHSDGCRVLNRVRVNGRTYAYPRYQFCNRSADIREIFTRHLDLLGIPWRQMNQWNISVARRDAVGRLDEFVGPKQ